MSNVLDLIRTAETMAPAAENLPAEIAGYEDSENPEVRGAWQIETLQSADWALARLAECEAEAAEIDRQAKAAIERVKARAEDLKAKAGRGANFFRFKLLAYAERHRTAILGAGKKKSRDFMHGKIGWRSKPERLEVENAAELEAWLVAQPVEAGLYRQKIEPEMAELQRRFKENGEIPPGMKIHIEPESIEIKATAPEAALERT
jgi:phage host-nuclease inhibitor protein Gam